MRIKFDFVETSFYRMDIELPEIVLLTYCEAYGISVEDVEDDPEAHAYDISQFIATNYENLGDSLEFRGGESEVYNAELEV